MSGTGLPFARLVELTGAARGEVVGTGTTLKGVSDDSRQISPGNLFVCSPSLRHDTHSFLALARESGASAALVHSEAGLAQAESCGLSAVFVADTGTRFHSVVSLASQEILGFPDQKLKTFAVTGTNGKTTTAWMIRDALQSLGFKAAYVGTLGYKDGEVSRALENTSPFPVTFWNLLARAVEQKCQYFVTEASSHALFQGRMLGIKFNGAAFTHLTQDHLDFHRTMAAYAAAKKRLFLDYVRASSSVALPHDEPFAAECARETFAKSFSYGPEEEADLWVEPSQVGLESLDLHVQWKGKSVEISVPVGGNFNVLNAGSALAGLLSLGISFEDACRGITHVTPVPGRFEAIQNDKGIGVIVDYAHTPDALEKLLESVRVLRPHRIATVFGCGGDRDKTKRPLMAQVASSKSDFTVVTSDNPRTEDSEKIIAEVSSGIKPGSNWESVTDRRAAIRKAIRWAKPGDVVVIAGKGHEDYQVLGSTKHHFDDREVAREELS